MKKMQQQKGKRKGGEYQKGIMSFDSFMEEASNFNDVDVDEEIDFADDPYGDLWDDDVDWTQTALRHEYLNDAEPTENEGIYHPLSELLDQSMRLEDSEEEDH